MKETDNDNISFEIDSKPVDIIFDENFLNSICMNQTFDTITLIKIRLATLGEFSFPEPNQEIINQWKQYRNIFIKNCENRNIKANYESFKKVFHDVWKSFQCFALNDNLYLPPLYKSSTMIDTIINHFIVQVVARERGMRVDMGNMILNGVQGTGKTLLLKLFCCAVAVCCNNLFYIFYDYKSSSSYCPSSISLILETAERTEKNILTVNLDLWLGLPI